MKSAGALLQRWRVFRRLSQMQLALDCNVSQRHLSFLESGRARGSRVMLLKISEALDMPLRARNELLLAAGFAPFYPERRLDSPEQQDALPMVQRMLDHHEPYPALALDSAWDIVLRNSAATSLISQCVAQHVLARMAGDGKLNFMRLMCSPEALQKSIRSWPRTGRALLNRLRREASASPGSPSEPLLRELLEIHAFPGFADPGEAHLEATIPIEIEVQGTLIRLLTATMTFGTPQDVNLQELRIEMTYPADDSTEQALRRTATS